MLIVGLELTVTYIYTSQAASTDAVVSAAAAVIGRMRHTNPRV